jgi:hypothetical protein
MPSATTSSHRDGKGNRPNRMLVLSGDEERRSDFLETVCNNKDTMETISR